MAGLSANPARIVLVGPSGSGKSSVAELVARRIGYRSIDVDGAIVERIGMPISEFFERFGEPAFRAIETEEVIAACATPGVVVATGGGAVLAPENWTALRPGSVVIALLASPATLVRRVREHAEEAGDDAIRPLLAGDAAARMASMLEARGPLYRQADVVIDTEDLTLEEVAAEVERAAHQIVAEHRVPALSMATPLERSDIYVGQGARQAVPALIGQRWPKARTVWVITDDNVAVHWAEETSTLLEASGYSINLLRVAPGETSKSMAELDRLTGEMVASGVTRRDVVVALGGGVVGDLAGLVAALCLRGLPLLQLPTSLLAMVDSSVGGKTAVNSAGAKNMVGAFYQPGVVVVDPEFLSTLPAREYRCGMAEVIKHAHIQPSTPFGGDALMEILGDAGSLAPLPPELVEQVLLLNVSIKHSVVQADERESRLRMILNFGHTAGHAIEAQGFRYLHGEAVALGMLAASTIARERGLVDATYISRLEELLERAGLSTRFEGDIDGVLANISRDKKNVDGDVQWILPAGHGVEIVSGVEVSEIRRALEVVTGRSITSSHV